VVHHRHREAPQLVHALRVPGRFPARDGRRTHRHPLTRTGLGSPTATSFAESSRVSYQEPSRHLRTTPRSSRRGAILVSPRRHPRLTAAPSSSHRGAILVSPRRALSGIPREWISADERLKKNSVLEFRGTDGGPARLGQQAAGVHRVASSSKRNVLA